MAFAPRCPPTVKIWSHCGENSGQSATECSSCTSKAPIIEIQHSRTWNFIQMLRVPQPPAKGPKADVQFRHLWFSTLTAERETSVIS